MFRYQSQPRETPSWHDLIKGLSFTVNCCELIIIIGLLLFVGVTGNSIVDEARVGLVVNTHISRSIPNYHRMIDNNVVNFPIIQNISSWLYYYRHHFPQTKGSSKLSDSRSGWLVTAAN